MTAQSRRYFWGNSLPQAVMSAARYHGIEPSELAFAIYAKRHGFVKHPRKVVIEVDPAHPRRAAGGASPPATPPAEAKRARPVPPPRDPERRAGPDRPTGREPIVPRNAPVAARPAAAEGEGWDPPDEDSELAAVEAAGRLLRLAGFDLVARVSRADDRLDVELTGADVPRLREHGGLTLLDDLEHLLPRAVHGLSGKMVRCRIDCGGLRGEREAALRTLARAEAERVLATAEERVLEALPPAERRIVHLELAERPGLRTESVGSGYRKRVRIRPA